MKRIFLILLLGLMCTLITNVYSQDYNTALGIRGGLGSGITFKHFVKENAALEAIVSSRWRGLNVTALYEIHANAFDVPGLNWYYGAGAHVGFWRYYRNHPWLPTDRDYAVFGIDGIIGMEYNIKEIPINFSLDWKPAINLIGWTGFWADEVAISVRFLFR